MRAAAVRAAAVRGNGRPAYRHSVIRGGAYSVAEVERARRADPIVDAHYAVFDPARLRIARAPAARSLYVSYRIGSDVYWTRHRVLLAAGEALITDGEQTARARCGNRVADVPQQPVAADEPQAADLDALDLPVPPETDWELPSALVVDLFPPEPLSQTEPGTLAPSQPSPWLAGVGMGMGTVGLLPAHSPSPSPAPPGHGGIALPGTGPFVAAPPAPGWSLPLVGGVPVLPNPPLASSPPPNPGFSPTGPVGPKPIVTPPPGTWTFVTPPVVVPVPQPPKPGVLPSVVPAEALPEPETALLLAMGLALMVFSEIRRRR